MSKRGLGKGLGALVPEAVGGQRDLAVPIEIGCIRPNPRQPRQLFGQEKLNELAQSLREHGLVQPIVVRSTSDGYELVAGERRWRAAQLAGMETIPAIVRNMSSSEALEIALIENLQREDLNPIEEAEAYETLIGELAVTQEELGRRLGKSRPHIANCLRLLGLPAEVRALVAARQVSMGHAKVLLGLEDEAVLTALARRVVAAGLSVRELEEDVARARAQREAKGSSGEVRGEQRNPEIVGWESRLRETLGSPVRIIEGSPRGRIEVTYFGPEDLTRLLEILGGTARGAASRLEGTRRMTV